MIMMKTYQVEITQSAEIDVAEIFQYYQAINPQFADTLFNNIEKIIDSLSTMPYRGKIVPELDRFDITQYRQLIVNNYRVFYQIIVDRVIIIGVVDSRRELTEWLLKRLIVLDKSDTEIN